MKLFVEIIRRVVVISVMAVIWWALWNFIAVPFLGLGTRCNNFLVWFILAIAEMIPVDLADPGWASTGQVMSMTILNTITIGILFLALAIFF